MSDDSEKTTFDVEKLEALEVESSQELRPAKTTRRGKKANPDQFDLFSQNSFKPQEPQHDSNDDASESKTRNDEHEVQQLGGIQNSATLAQIRTGAGRRLAAQTDIEQDSGADGERSGRSANSTGEDAPDESGGIGSGSVEPTDEILDAGRGRTGSLRRDGYVTSALAGEEEPAKPSRDYRITDESRIGEGSLREKAQLNINAIQLLKKLEAEGRSATNDEKHILARYTGWGAMPAVFDYMTGRYDEWNEVRDTVKFLLTDEEHRTASGSIANAHYTSPLVINGIWSALERFGVKAGMRVLEPSMGVGNFYGLMPEHMMPKSLRAGVELDSVTARIAKQLYQDATIFESRFEDAPFPDGFFDVAVGNVPFGNYGVHDANYKAWQTSSIHDYFFIKTLDKLRPGGVLALITSRYTMDKVDDNIRAYLAEKADLLGAIRLPNTTFKGNAGTVVTTDILFLQKREAGQEPVGPAWQNANEITTGFGGEGFALNEYYIENPKMMLGKMQLVHSRYAEQPELLGELTQEALQEAIENLPRDIYAPRIETPKLAPVPQFELDASAFTGVKNGAYAIVENELGIFEDGQFTSVALKGKKEARVRGMMKIRDCVRDVFKTQLNDASDEVIVEARQNLNRVYDKYIREFGCLSNAENRRSFSTDPEAPLLLSLETDYDEATNKAKKASIFSQRTIERYKPVESVETAAEALAVSLNEYGRIEWGRMAQLTGMTPTSMQAELGDMVYQNPESDFWETADEYLSGNVRQKLRFARSASELDPRFKRNLAPLEAAQLTDLTPAEIMVRLGATWVPADDLADWIAEAIDTRASNIRVDYLNDLATWKVNAKEIAKQSVANKTTYGTSRFTAINLIEDALNGVVSTAYDTIRVDDKEKRIVNEQETLAAREAQQKLKDMFGEWVWKDSDRTARLVGIYNEKFNSTRLRSYDGSHLTFPGMNKAVLRGGELDPHQKNGVWRILQGDSTLLAHCVGAGKTWEMVAAAMEAKRIGLAKKSMIVVPNHLVDQWGAAFLQLYPQANIFVAGKEHFQHGKRQKAMSRIATGNYDAVIVSHKSFEMLPVSDKLFDTYLAEELDRLEDAIREANEDSDNRRIVKMLETAKKRLTKKIEDRAKRETKDNTISFEELGIDRILVDEADLYKNLGIVTKMNRIAGLPNAQSNRATDMHMKTRYLREQNNGKGVVFATATPVSNTMAELYTMQRYLAPEALADAGLANFDAWAANFGEAVTALELAPSGKGYRMNTRFARFINLPELLTMFREFADVQTPEMLNLPRPSLEGGKNIVITAPATPALERFVDNLVDRADKIRSGTVDPRDDNMLKVTSEGRKAALDMRLVHPHAQAHPQSKVSLCANEVFKIWQDTADRKATQLIFCDLSTPKKGGGFNVYDEIRSQLLRKGVPPHEIAFIHDAKTDAAKLALFQKVNSGQIRVLLGSTEKMGAGTNVQRKLYAEHHLDAPWRPRDVEQRDGRILRQGNENEAVRIYRYVTEGSFDAYMWQGLESKAKFISQVMTGDTSVRVADDVNGSALTFAEIKAIASGNPAVMEKVKVDTEVRKLDGLRTAHRKRQFELTQKIVPTEELIKSNTAQLGHVQADIKTRNDNHSEEFSMVVAGKTFEGKDAREKAAKALDDTLMAWRNTPSLKGCGKIGGFDVLCQGKLDGGISVYLRGAATYTINYNPDNPIGTLMSIERTMRGFEVVQSKLEAELAHGDKALAEYRLQSEKPFEQEERLKELLQEQARLNTLLDLNKDDKQAITIAANDEDYSDSDIDLDEIDSIDIDDMTSADAPERFDNDNEMFRQTGTEALTP
jgi:N12 class adenine-specific DNA methylase